MQNATLTPSFSGKRKWRCQGDQHIFGLSKLTAPTAIATKIKAEQPPIFFRELRRATCIALGGKLQTTRCMGSSPGEDLRNDKQPQLLSDRRCSGIRQGLRGVLIPTWR